MSPSAANVYQRLPRISADRVGSKKFHVKLEYFKKDVIGEIDGNPQVVVVWKQY